MTRRVFCQEADEQEERALRGIDLHPRRWMRGWLSIQVSAPGAVVLVLLHSGAQVLRMPHSSSDRWSSSMPPVLLWGSSLGGPCRASPNRWAVQTLQSISLWADLYYLCTAEGSDRCSCRFTVLPWRLAAHVNMWGGGGHWNSVVFSYIVGGFSLMLWCDGYSFRSFLCSINVLHAVNSISSVIYKIFNSFCFQSFFWGMFS